MKKKTIGKIITLLLAGVLTVGTLTGCGKKAEANADGSEKIVIKAATSGNPRPFTYIGDDGELLGQNIELIQAVFDRLPQYELEIEVTEFPSIFTGIDSNLYQLGVNNIAKNP